MSPTEASTCLYAHWAAGSQDLELRVATDEAMAQLWNASWSPPTVSGPECELVSTPHGDAVCTTTYGPDWTVEMYLTDLGHDLWQVQAVGFLGEPPRPVD